jgi:hypothetical protein
MVCVCGERERGRAKMREAGPSCVASDVEKTS